MSGSLIDGTIIRDNLWRNELKNPDHAKILNKPVVDVGRPLSHLREHDQARWVSWQAMGMWMWNCVLHFIYTPEVVPYVESYSTRECCFAWYGAGFMFYMNYFTARHGAGSINAMNPRTRWAHSVVFWTHMMRGHLAWFIGVCGYFYSYEFLYTHVPPFKIRDPSPEGWKRCGEDGQSTYLSRFGASVFPALAYATWKGGFKRMYLWWGQAWFWSTYYEMCRPVFAGSLHGITFNSYQQHDKLARLGQLSPEMHRRIDPDTNRPFWIAQYEYLRLSHGRNYDEITKVTHDYAPAGGGLIGNQQPNFNLKMRNPYFNFQKAPQLRRDKPLRYKSQLFVLPDVTEAKMLSGAYDRLPQTQ